MEWARPSASELVRAGLATPAGGVDDRRVGRVVAELERGLKPAQSGLLEWCCQKLFVLPTQNGNGISAALMTDNFVDVCSHFADDLWQSTTLELLKSCTFRPSPAQFVAIAEPRHSERKRMLARVKTLLAPKPDAPKPFEPEPRVVRLRSMRDSYRKHGYADRATKVELELAEVEGRKPEDWSYAAVANPPTHESDEKLSPPTRPTSPEQRVALNLALAAKHRAAGRYAWADQLDQQSRDLGYVPTAALPHDEAPMPDAIPE